MIKKFRIGRWRFTFTMAPVTDVVGVDSTLEDGGHVLMWDFDDIPFNWVVNTLLRTQRAYDLPKIYILETKDGSNWIAYCFKRMSLVKAVEIVAFTQHVDWSFIRFGAYRQHFTLRVGPKYGRIPRLAWVLGSKVPEDCSIKELKRWLRYETLAKE